MLALALPGHLDGSPLTGRASTGVLLDAVERMLDAAGVETAHVAGNSLGGYLALRLAERGRARSVTALAPAGGWEAGDPARGATLALQAETYAAARAAAPHAEALLATEEGRRRATRQIAVRYEHIPAALLAHQLRGIAACAAAPALLAAARADRWPLDPERIACPVRILWGTEDRLLPWPSAAARWRRLLPQADWAELPGVGHCPQLDVPLETGELVLGRTWG